MRSQSRIRYRGRLLDLVPNYAARFLSTLSTGPNNDYEFGSFDAYTRNYLALGMGHRASLPGDSFTPLDGHTEYLYDFNNHGERRVTSPCIHIRYVRNNSSIYVIQGGPSITSDNSVLEYPSLALYPPYLEDPKSSNFALRKHREFLDTVIGRPGLEYDQNILIQDKENFSIWFPIVDVLMLGGLIRQASRLAKHALEFVRSPEYGFATIRSLADGHLAYRFGFLPLLSDIRQMRTACLNYKKWCEETLDGITHRRYRHLPDTFDTDWETDPRTIVQNVSGLRLVLQRRRRLTVNRSLYYAIVSPDMVSWGSRFRQIIDRFGVLDPSAPWDLIPFSFVLDWFLDVSGFLRKHKPVISNLAIEDATECRSHHMFIDYRWAIESRGSYYRGNELLDSYVTRRPGFSRVFLTTEQFVRYPVKPVFKTKALIGRGRGITLSRIAVSASLIAQRVHTNPIVLKKHRKVR